LQFDDAPACIRGGSVGLFQAQLNMTKYSLAARHAQCLFITLTISSDPLTALE